MSQLPSAGIALDRLRWIIHADRAAIPCGYWEYQPSVGPMAFFLHLHFGRKYAISRWRWKVRR